MISVNVLTGDECDVYLGPPASLQGRSLSPDRRIFRTPKFNNCSSCEKTHPLDFYPTRGNESSENCVLRNIEDVAFFDDRVRNLLVSLPTLRVGCVCLGLCDCFASRVVELGERLSRSDAWSRVSRPSQLIGCVINLSYRSTESAYRLRTGRSSPIELDEVIFPVRYSSREGRKLYFLRSDATVDCVFVTVRLAFRLISRAPGGVK